MILYTSVTGNKDTLKNQPGSERAVAFVDTDISHPRWESVHIDSAEANPNRKAKIYKVCPDRFFDDDTIFIDGNVTLKWSATDIFNMAFNGNDCDLAVFKHPHRDNWLDEAYACIAGGMDDTATIEKHIARYKEMAVNIPNLAWCGFLIRRNTSKCKEFNACWWDEICAGSRRDQISFPYAVYKTGVKVNFMDCPKDFENNEFYEKGSHNW